MDAKEIIQTEYNHYRNLFTPKIKGYGKLNQRFAYEFSYGTGMSRNPIYGVTIVGLNSHGETFRTRHLSKLFHDLNEAKKYIRRLKYKLSKKVYR